ncbi:RING finger protein unkempt [Planococcus citri]|uniref:RING finger protein unkempt n=1 Tax=Planococcus citri TaxID=170843 RepID=UPI0031F7D62F
MPSESKPLLTTPTEKPHHYTYLKEFRVEQCTLFLQHKCSQHRPFSCFNWHFHNQRRRRPVRKRDGTFNYSADNYCSRYDETTGLCPDGDDCPYLHRTAGDTERRYHLRYYKTCVCVHDTDNRGNCVKNGPHCAFAHGNHDLRPPVYDIKELQAQDMLENAANSAVNNNGPNVLDKERNTMSEDPKWQDTAYILAYYKTEACKRPPRLCRQGYACPHFHNIRDKRRNPQLHKYRSTPCPNVKHGDEWGEPTSCENGDTCIYCHTRTEQQFHPEIYKSSKCNDVQQSGYCPRGAFCAFAHLDEEMTIVRDMAAALEVGKSLSEILESMAISTKHDNLPTNDDDCNLETSDETDDLTESDTVSSIASENSLSKAPGAQLSNHQIIRIESAVYNNNTHNAQQQEQDAQKANWIRKELVAIETDPLLDPIERAQRKQSLYEEYSNLSSTSPSNVNGICLNNNINSGLDLSPLSSHFRYNNDNIESVLGSKVDDLQLDDTTLPLTSVIDREFDKCASLNNSISAGLQSSGILCPTPPVNIPSSALNDQNQVSRFSPVTSPLMNSGFLSSRFHTEPIDNTFLNHTSSLQGITNNSVNNTNKLNAVGSQFRTASPLYDFPLPSSVVGAPTNVLNRQILPLSNSFSFSSEEKIKSTTEILRRETENLQRKLNIAEQQRDEAVAQAKDLKKEVDLLQGSPYLHGLRRISELKNLSLSALKSLQSQLKTDLEEIEKVLYLQTATKCILCEENNRSVTLGPCNHFVICHSCAPSQKMCPYCQTPIATQTSSVSSSA